MYTRVYFPKLCILEFILQNYVYSEMIRLTLSETLCLCRDLILLAVSEILCLCRDLKLKLDTEEAEKRFVKGHIMRIKNKAVDIKVEEHLLRMVSKV